MSVNCFNTLTCPCRSLTDSGCSLFNMSIRSAVVMTIWSIALGDGWRSAVGWVEAAGTCVRVAARREIAEPHEAVSSGPSLDQGTTCRLRGVARAAVIRVFEGETFGAHSGQWSFIPVNFLLWKVWHVDLLLFLLGVCRRFSLIPICSVNWSYIWMGQFGSRVTNAARIWYFKLFIAGSAEFTRWLWDLTSWMCGAGVLLFLVLRRLL